MKNAIASEITRPTDGAEQGTLGGGGEDDRQREDHRLQALAPNGLEGEQGQAGARAAGERGVRAGTEFPGQPARVSPHPERHVGQHDGGEQVGACLEDGLHIRAVVLADREVGGDPAARGERERRTNADEHVTEVPALPYPVEVGEQDRDDHARFDPFPHEDHEGRDHGQLLGDGSGRRAGTPSVSRHPGDYIRQALPYQVPWWERIMPDGRSWGPAQGGLAGTGSVRDHAG